MVSEGNEPFIDPFDEFLPPMLWLEHTSGTAQGKVEKRLDLYWVAIDSLKNRQSRVCIRMRQEKREEREN